MILDSVEKYIYTYIYITKELPNANLCTDVQWNRKFLNKQNYENLSWAEKNDLNIYSETNTYDMEDFAVSLCIVLQILVPEGRNMSAF